MPKSTGHRSARFKGEYRFAPRTTPDECHDAATPVSLKPMVKGTGSKPRFKGQEIVFLVNWLDVCLTHGDDEDRFRKTVVKEFYDRYRRVINAKTAERKCVTTVQELANQTGSKFVSKNEVISRGSRCIDWHRAPEELIDDHNAMRLDLGLPLVNTSFESPMREDQTPSSESEQGPPTRRPPFVRPPPNVENSAPDIIVKSRMSVAPPLAAPVSTPIRADTSIPEDFESAIEVQDRSETQSTVVGKANQDLDHTQTSWESIEEDRADTKDPQPDSRDGKITMLSNMVSWFLERHRHGWEGTEAELARLESIRKEVLSDHDQVFASLLNELTGEEKKTAKYQSIVKSVVGTVSIIQPEITNAPHAPSAKAIEGEWRLLWERCRLLTQTIVVDKKFASRDFQRLYESADMTFRGTPHYKAILQQSAQFPLICDDDLLFKLQACMARLLFIFVFEYPTILLEHQHSHLLKHLYTMIGAAGDMSEVKRLDLLATEMFIKDDRTQNELIPHRANERTHWITELLGLTASSDPYDAIIGDLRELCYRAIKLYSQLLVSPIEYLIHFFPRGTQFAADCMKAEDVVGTPLSPSQCIGRTVKLCLFPAIWQYCGPPTNQSELVDEGLTTSKRFLRTSTSEINMNLSLVSKAIVLFE